MDSFSRLKIIVKKWASALLPTGMYFMDAGMDASSSYDFCTDGQTWWCGLSAGFIIMPEMVVSAFIAYKIWRDRDKKKIAARKEDFAILAYVPEGTLTTIIAILFFLIVPTMILPFVMLPWLSFKALQDENASDDSSMIIRKTQLAMLQLKGMETLLQTCPQLSLKSYIVIHKLHCAGGAINSTSINMTTPAGNSQNYKEYCEDIWSMDDHEVGSLDVISPFGSLCSLCFSIASLVIDENNYDWYRKTVWFLALLSSIGSRMMVCGVLASWNQGLWFVPPVTGCIIALASKKLRYILIDKDKNKDFSTREALKVVLEEGLLLSYPSPEGLLTSASYIGYAVWFYVNGTLIDGGTDAELGLEALTTCIVGQGMCLILAFIALRLGYETPDILPAQRTTAAGQLPDSAVVVNMQEISGQLPASTDNTHENNF